MKYLLLLAVFALTLNAQNPGPFVIVQSDPTGNSCGSNSVVERTPQGIIYTCQNGAYASSGASFPAATGAGQVLTSTGAGTTYTAQTPASGLPTATAPGQAPVSTGAGTTYTARAVSQGDGTPYIFTSKPPKFRYVASSLPLADGATVATWPDSSGNGFDATAGTSDTIMNRQATVGSPAVHLGGAGSLTLPAGLALNAQNHTVCIVYEALNGGLQSTMVMLNLNGAAYYIQQKGGTSPYTTSEFHINSVFRVPSGAQMQVVCNVAGPSSVITYTPYVTATTAALTAGTSSGGWIGSFNGSGFYYTGNLFEVVGWDSQLTATDILSVLAYSRSTYETSYSPERAVKVGNFGDSIVVGGIVTLERNYINRSFPVLKAGQDVPFEENDGLGSTTLQQGAVSCAQISATYDATFGLNIASVAWGTNDIVNSGRTALQMEGDALTIAACIKTANPLQKVLFSTVTPNNNSGCTTDAVRQTYNAWLKAGGIVNVDGIIDYTVDPRVDVCVSGGNAVYYADAVHPNDAGHQAMAAVRRKQMDLFISKNTPLPGPSTITNCSSSASPAVCGSAAGGSVAFPTGVTSVALTVNTTAVTANSQILLFPDDTLGTKLGVTCNSTLATLVGGMAITARTAGTSFQVTYSGTIATNPLCASYLIVN